MTEPRRPEPDEELLEFLGGIDEVNDDSKDADFSDFLANGGLEKADEPAEKPKAPVKEGQ